MSDVPIFDPNGIVRDIPYEQMKSALAAGGKPGVRMQAPDGKIRVVPASMTQQAASAGGKLLPIEEQAAEHPGFWGAVAEDAVPALKGVGMLLLGAPGQAYSAMRKGLDEINSYSDTGKTTEQLQNERQKADNRGAAYRLLATPLAQGVGVNVPGMEASAQAGDQGGVLGHAAVPAAMAAAPLVGEAALRGSAAVLKSRPGQTGMALAKGAAKVADVATFDRLSKAANAIKSTVGELGDIWNPQAEPPPATPSTSAPTTPIYRDATLNSRNFPEFAGSEMPPAASPKTTIYRDATLNRKNIPDFAGEAAPAPKSNTLQTPLGKFSWQVSKADIAALPKPVGDIVDAAVPKSTNPQVNLSTKAEVALKMKMGDLQGAAETIKDAAAKTGSRADLWQDKGIQELQQDQLEGAGIQARKAYADEAEQYRYKVMREARRNRAGAPTKVASPVTEQAPIYDQHYNGPVNIETIDDIRSNPKYPASVRRTAQAVHEAVLDSGMNIDDAMRLNGNDALAKVLGGKFDKTINAQGYKPTTPKSTEDLEDLTDILKRSVAHVNAKRLKK